MNRIRASPEPAATCRRRSSPTRTSSSAWTRRTSGSARAPASSAATSRPRRNDRRLAEHAARARWKPPGMTPADVDFIVVGTTTPDLHLSEYGHAAAAAARHSRLPGIRPRDRLQRLHLCAVDRGQVRAAGESKCALVVGVESPVAVHELDGSRHGHAVRRRRRRRRADAGRRAGHHRHAPALRRQVPGPALLPTASPRDSTPGRRLHQDAGQRSLQDRGAHARRAWSRDAREERGRAHALDWLVPHQANLRIIQSAADKLGLPMEKVGRHRAGSRQHVERLDSARARHGVRDGRIHRGELLLLETFGGGFTWGSALIRY